MLPLCKWPGRGIMCYNPLYDTPEGYEAAKAQEDSAVDANAATGTRLEETAKDSAEKTGQAKAQGKPQKEGTYLTTKEMNISTNPTDLFISSSFIL